MPKIVRVSDADMSWLEQNHDRVSYHVAAKRIGCCVDTLKRILMREGLQDFDGAKYQVGRREDKTKMWERPCIACGSKESRPKLWYFCTPCRSERGYSE